MEFFFFILQAAMWQLPVIVGNAMGFSVSDGATICEIQNGCSIRRKHIYLAVITRLDLSSSTDIYCLKQPGTKLKYVAYTMRSCIVKHSQCPSSIIYFLHVN